MINGREGLPIEGIAGIDSFRDWTNGFRRRIVETFPSEMIHERRRGGRLVEQHRVIIPGEPWLTIPNTIQDKLIRHYATTNAETGLVSIVVDRPGLYFVDPNHTRKVDPHVDLLKNSTPTYNLTLVLESQLRGSAGDWVLEEIPPKDREMLHALAQRMPNLSTIATHHRDWIEDRRGIWRKSDNASIDELRFIANFLKSRMADAEVERYFIEGELV